MSARRRFETNWKVRKRRKKTPKIFKVHLLSIKFIKNHGKTNTFSPFFSRKLHQNGYRYGFAEHHGNWLESIKLKKQPIAPVEAAHRACSTCLVHHIAMKVKRKVYWDPIKEVFKDDAEANSMLSREQRAPYVLK